MSNHVYLAFFNKEVGGGYSVTFPDVPGAISEGDDFSDALNNAKEALESYLDSLVADGEKLPQSRPFSAVVGEAGGAIVAAIEADTETKTVRVNVSFDERLLARIDRAAEESGRTRSGFLARAAREWLSGRRANIAGLRVVGQHADSGFYEQTRAVFERGAEATSKLRAAIEDLRARLSSDGYIDGLRASIPSGQQVFGSGTAYYGPFVDAQQASDRFGMAGCRLFVNYAEGVEESDDDVDYEANWAELSG